MIAVYIGWLRGMVWIIMSKPRSGQWWKPGHSFPQLLLHKHVFFSPYFFGLSWAPPPDTLFGYCTATHSRHSFRGPCLLIPMAYSWPGLGCLLHVRSTPWLTGSSFLNGEGVQRVCSCHHNKWAARLPLTALLQGKGEVEGMRVGAARCLTVCGLLGHCKTAARQAGVVLRKWTKPPWESASWLPPAAPAERWSRVG